MSRILRCACLMIAVAAAMISAPNPPQDSVLERGVPSYSVQGEARIKALVQFARLNRIPLAIEVSGPELDERVSLHIAPTSVRQAIHALLGNSRAYVVDSSQGIVSIRSGTDRSRRWLETIIPRFAISPTTIAHASASLWMTLERQLDPAQQGFAGSFPPGDPEDLVGPLDIRGATVRVLLSHLLRESPQTSWIVTRASAALEPPAAVNRFWTMMYRPGPAHAGRSSGRDGHARGPFPCRTGP